MADNTINIQEIVEETSAKARFTLLDGDRGTILTRARDCSKLTIPSILPDEGHDEQTALETPYQALGARLVNNLASKLLLALLPPNTSFFRLLVEDEVKEDLEGAGDTEVLTELEQRLVTIEQALLKQIEKEALRVPTFELAKSLIVTGNALAYKTEQGLKSYRLDQYVIQRDFVGNVIEIITKESTSYNSLPEEIRATLEVEDEAKDVDIFTRALLKNGQWVEYQEVEDTLVDGSDVIYSDLDKLPFIPLRWSAINGENYGRGLVEQFLGDFRSLEALYQLLIESSAVQARTIFGKRPGSQVDLDELNTADNGAVIYGDLEQDITTLRVDKGGDLQLALELTQQLTRRLEQAFLVSSSAVRDSERTTLGEIRYLAQDLEESLGGLHSILSQEFQLPLAKHLLSTINIPLDGLDVVIVTGVEALGRNNDLDKLRQFNGIIQELGTPEIMLSRLNVGGYMQKVANALAIDDITSFIKSDEQLQQEQVQAQQQQLQQQGMSNMIEGATTPQQQQ